MRRICGHTGENWTAQTLRRICGHTGEIGTAQTGHTGENGTAWNEYTGEIGARDGQEAGMKRNPEELWDGRYYSANDMVRADCAGCEGCSHCCHGMGESLELDPYDFLRLARGLRKKPEELLTFAADLHVDDGLIVPFMKMSGDSEACTFLGPDGRCTIHEFRPDICRLFPLGRVYDETGIRYILQSRECICENRREIPVRDWVAEPEGERYEQYRLAYHDFRNAVKRRIRTAPSADTVKICNMMILTELYMKPAETDRLTDELERRMEELRERILI